MPLAEAERLICIDVGTTNTRAWSLQGPDVVARVEEGIGARDVARDGHAEGLRLALVRIVGRLLEDAGAAPPACIAAAGMITSRHGLVEVPYVVAPASAKELRSALRRIELPEFPEIPFVLVPGVQTLQRPGAAAGIPGSDVMRGEETLCMGLVQLGQLRPGDCLLNLGSHWKLVQLDAEARIAWSFTSLAGELLHATRRETVLASALPEGSLSSVHVPSFEEGMAELRRSGLPRAFFCLRLFEIAAGRAPAKQLSYAVGVLVASDIDAWRQAGLMPRGRVLIAGGDRLGGAWSVALGSAACQAIELSRPDVESGFLAGLRFLAAARD